jgi:hypothetical protein
VTGSRWRSVERVSKQRRRRLRPNRPCKRQARANAVEPEPTILFQIGFAFRPRTGVLHGRLCSSLVVVAAARCCASALQQTSCPPCSPSSVPRITTPAEPSHMPRKMAPKTDDPGGSMHEQHEHGMAWALLTGSECHSYPSPTVHTHYTFVHSLTLGPHLGHRGPNR